MNIITLIRFKGMLYNKIQIKFRTLYPNFYNEMTKSY